MPLARFIVCEKTGAWAVGLRRVLSAGRLRVFETRALDQCQMEVVSSPASLVAVEMTRRNLEEVVIWLKRLAADFPRVRTVVLGRRGLEASQWLVREAGAVHVVFSSRDLKPVVRIVQRHLARAETGRSSRLESIWQQLPWAGAELVDRGSMRADSASSDDTP